MFAVVVKRLWFSNLFTTWVAQGAAALRFFLLTPLILRHFSGDQIALWYLFGTVTMFSQVLDIGIMPTFSRYFGYAKGGASDLNSLVRYEKPSTRAVPNWHLIDRLFSSSGYLFMIIGASVLIIVGGLGSLAMIKPIQALQSPNQGWICWSVVVASITFTTFTQRYQAYLAGLGHVALVNRFTATVSIISLVCAGGILIATGSFTLTVIAIQGVQALGSLRGMMLASYVEGGIAKTFKSFTWDKELYVHIWGPSWKTSLSTVAGLGLSHLSGLLLAQFISPATAAPFLFAQRVLNFGVMFVSAPVTSFRPMIARMRAEGDVEQLRSGIERRIRYSLVGATILLFPIGVYMPWLLHIIGSHIDFVSFTVWFFMVLFAVNERFNSFNIIIQNSANLFTFHWLQLATTIAALIAIRIFVPRFGIFGLVLSIGIARLVFFNWQPLKAAAPTLRSGPWGLFLKTYGFALAVAAIIGLVVLCSTPGLR